MSHPHAVKNPERYKQRTLRAFSKVAVAMDDVEFDRYLSELKMNRITSRVVLAELGRMFESHSSLLDMFKGKTSTHVSSRELRSPYNH